MVRFDVGVGQQMRLKIRSLVEAPAAHGTLVGRFLHMQDLVNGQRPRLAESLSAFQAFEGFLLGVDVSAISFFGKGNPRGREKKKKNEDIKCRAPKENIKHNKFYENKKKMLKPSRNRKG